MRILITGATGFIGSHLVDRLATEHEIYALVRRNPTQAISGIHYIHQDLGLSLVHSQLPRELDAIIHQAAVIDTEAVDDSEPFLVNVVATWRLLAYAADAGVHTFIHASTGGIYGCGSQPFRESDPPNPMDLYSLTKAQAELAVNSAAGSFHKIILRYFFPYGLGTPNPIPDYVAKAIHEEPIQIIDGGGPQLNPIHIVDTIEATVRALFLQQSVTLNVAGFEATTFSAISECAARIAGKEAKFEPYSLEHAIPYYRSDLIASIEQMQSTLDFTPKVPIKTGIAELVASYYNVSQC